MDVLQPSAALGQDASAGVWQKEPNAQGSAQTGPDSAKFLQAVGLSGQQHNLLALRDDPNFYTFLEDFLGGKDEDAAVGTALSALNDFQQQLQFQNSQQQPASLSGGGPMSLDSLTKLTPDSLLFGSPMVSLRTLDTQKEALPAVTVTASETAGLPQQTAEASRQVPGATAAVGSSAQGQWANAAAVLRQEAAAFVDLLPRDFADKPLALDLSLKQEPFNALPFPSPVPAPLLLSQPVKGLSAGVASPRDTGSNDTQAETCEPTRAPGPPAAFRSSSANTTATSNGVEELEQLSNHSSHYSCDWSSAAQTSAASGPATVRHGGVFPSYAKSLPMSLDSQSTASVPNLQALQIGSAGASAGTSGWSFPVPSQPAGPVTGTAWQPSAQASSLPQGPTGVRVVSSGIPSKLPAPPTTTSLPSPALPAPLLHQPTTPIPSAAPSVLPMPGALSVPMPSTTSTPSAGGPSFVAQAGLPPDLMLLSQQQPQKRGPGRKPIGFKVTPKGIKLTRSEKQKQSLGALERQVQEKMVALESLSCENKNLQMRMQILELAVGRQQMALSLMANEPGNHQPLGGQAGGSGGPHSASRVDLGAGLPALLAGPGRLSQADLEWARSVTFESFMAWWKTHLGNVSAALLECNNGGQQQMPSSADERLNQVIAQGLGRTALVGLCQPTVLLRLKAFNMDTREPGEAPDSHWANVIRLMAVSPLQVEQLSLLFSTYTALHANFTNELEEAQQELNTLIAQGEELAKEGSNSKYTRCDPKYLEIDFAQYKVLKRVHSILQKTHVLYSATITIAAHHILMPREFAKCILYSWPHFPSGPALMQACTAARDSQQAAAM